MSQKIIDKLFAAMHATKGIPAPEGAVSAVLTTLRNAPKGSPDLVAQISADFSMTQKVLKLANSAMYAPFSDGNASVSGALNILGSDALLHLVLGVDMLTPAELQEDDSLSRTLLASELARTISTHQTEDASIAALMFDLGNLMASRFLPDEVATINRKVGAGATPEAAAAETLGMSFQELGVQVAKHWKLPEKIISIIDGTGDQTLLDIARFSSTASSMIHAGKADAVGELMAKLDIPDTDKTRLGSLVNRKLVEIAPVAKPIREDSPDIRLGELYDTLCAEKKNTVDELAHAMFSELSYALSTAHCILFMAIKSGDFLIRSGHGSGIEMLKGELRISAEFKPTVFHAAIKNNVDVVIADVGHLKPAALLDGYGTLLPNVASFVVMPIANTRVSGLLYLDWESIHELSQPTLIEMRKLRDLFLPFFPR